MSFEIKFVSDSLRDAEGKYRGQITLFYDGQIARHWMTEQTFEEPELADDWMKDALIDAEGPMLEALEKDEALKESKVP